MDSVAAVRVARPGLMICPHRFLLAQWSRNRLDKKDSVGDIQIRFEVFLLVVM